MTIKRAAKAVALLAFLLSVHAAALAQSTLYVTSIRGVPGSGESLMSGLYTVNLSTGTAQFAAPLRVGVKPVGITGLAVHPATGAFYGITSTISPNFPESLVSVDPTDGQVTVIGPLSFPGTDIVFDPKGTLYIWMPVSHQIGTIDLATGKVTPIGRPGPPDAMGGLAIDPKGRIYVTPGGASGSLDTVDPLTGVISKGPQLSGAPYPGAITSLAFTPSGLLLGVNSNVGSPAATRLVQINTSTGVMTPLGALPDDADGLAFAPANRNIAQTLETFSGRTLALFALIAGLGLGLAATAALLWLKRRDTAQKNTR
jgi:hypothetical protein